MELVFGFPAGFRGFGRVNLMQQAVIPPIRDSAVGQNHHQEPNLPISCIIENGLFGVRFSLILQQHRFYA